LTIIPPVNDRADAAGQGTAGLHGATVKTYDDHRMAMSLALVGLRVPGIFVADPACVGKTFPDYWERLSVITG
jgi:3-phosphoshikimate 1-carboxyvinyltransferase